jgi:hypothetical protein
MSHSGSEPENEYLDSRYGQFEAGEDDEEYDTASIASGLKMSECGSFDPMDPEETCMII